nr:hypothetical protein [Anaerolineae bacterium]
MAYACVDGKASTYLRETYAGVVWRSASDFLMTFFRRFWQLTTAIFIMVLFASTSQLLLAQDGSDEVDTILDSLSTEERIGQLFLITMAGDSVAASPAVIRLIQDYHVGGVILTASNNNFNDTNSLLDQVSALTADLQYIAAGYVRGVDGALYAPETEISGTYIPLFVGIEDMGQDWPYYPLLTGLTPPVSSMAIGATWDPVNAEAIGQILGAELASLGINLYLGPSADVVETAQSQTQANFGTRTFGGEPFWVASMVASFVSGMHNG